jgi:hypothetical protein
MTCDTGQLSAATGIAENRLSVTMLLVHMNLLQKSQIPLQTGSHKDLQLVHLTQPTGQLELKSME